jgi:hypothetical protein
MLSILFSVFILADVISIQVGISEVYEETRGSRYSGMIRLEKEIASIKRTAEK